MLSRSSRLSIVVLITLFALLWQQRAHAQIEGYGLGLVLGEPTGISFKTWTSQQNAIDAALAWSFAGPEEVLHIHGDYLWHFYDLIEVEEGQLPLYVGAGGRLQFYDEVGLGFRIPLGITYLFEDVPIDIFLEVVPILNLIPATEFDLDAGIGVRYYLTKN